jgi:virginiamycin B lyase
MRVRDCFGLLFVTVLAACGGGGGASAPSLPLSSPTPTIAPAAQASVTVHLSASPVFVTLPNVGAFGGSMLLPADPAAAGTAVVITISTVVPSYVSTRLRAWHPMDAATYTPILYFTVTAQGAAVLANSPGFSISGVTPAANMEYFLSIFDPANPASNVLVGPGVANGSSLNFQLGSNALTFTDSETYEFALFGLPVTTPTPTPPPAVPFQQFPLPGNADPETITTGPDGNLWFVAGNVNNADPSYVGRMTTSGVLSTFPISYAPNGASDGIATGPDGNLWFTEGPNVARITPGGTLTEFSMGGRALPAGITVGPDDNLWVADYNAGGAVHQISTAGAVLQTFTPFGATNSVPFGITTGPDGALWMTQFALAQGGPNYIGRMTTSGSYTNFSIPAQPDDIVQGSDGNLWFGESFGSNFDRMTTSGVDTPFFIAEDASVYGIAVAPDGSFWVAELAGTLAHISISGTIIATYYIGATQGVTSVCVGPDGNIWFTEQSGEIGKLTP